MVNETVVIVVLVQTFAILAVLLVYASRYKRVAPDKAMVVYGRQMRPGTKIGYRVVTGGGKFILPIIEETRYMDLGIKETVLEVDNLRTDPNKDAALIRLKLTAWYRISDERYTIDTACEHLLEKTPEDIKRIIEVNVRGHIRGIVANMTARDVDLHRDQVEEIFQTQAAPDLLNIGIEVRTLRIIDVHVKGGA